MDWPTDIAGARQIQNELRGRVRIENDFNTPELIAGIDVGYDNARALSRAAIVVVDARSLSVRDSCVAFLPTTFPYVPGFLSFREIPVIIEALASLCVQPDLLMVDGHGIAHPRRLGIAAHLGVLLDRPAIGVAKSLLTGRYTEPDVQKGASEPLWDGAERIGTVLRSRERVKPLFISPGHRVDHKTAVALTLRCLTRYRLPEPTRLADKLSKTGASLPLTQQRTPAQKDRRP